MSDFRRFFAKGLAIVLPTIVTLWLLWQAFVFVFDNVAQPINRATRLSVIWVVPQVMSEESLPDWFSITDAELTQYRDTREVSANVGDPALRRELRREYLREFWEKHWYLNLTGLVLAIVIIYLAGVLLGNIVGKSIYSRLERLITQLPGFKQIYPHVKQLVELILGDKKMAFSQVVVVEYPSKDIWTVGFLTGNSLREIDDPAGGAVVSVFIPTSPTPFTGFTINILKNKAIPLSMTVDEALRFVITAGVLAPDDDDQTALDQASFSGEIERAKLAALDAPESKNDDSDIPEDPSDNPEVSDGSDRRE